MSDLVASIRESFSEEAARSPLLLSDLTSLERYVSESYTGRSLIELLQNADDAGARRFFVKSLGGHNFAVANDGRTFTEDDVVALCRSGSPTKSRHAGTIGYRGIGFKSVVNYAKAVHLVSGETRLTFSRELTQALLGCSDSVPLVRIPHEFQGRSFQPELDACHSAGLSTVFIFESREDALLDEMSAFDESCLLFLHHVQATEFERGIGSTVNRLAVRAPHPSGAVLVSVTGHDSPEDWLVYSDSNRDRSEAVAFRLQGQSIVKLPWSESVVHSFMPTQDRLRFPVRVNGDFSTDPSRTRVVMDADTDTAARHCGDVLGELAVEILDAGVDHLKVLQALSDASADPLAGVRGKSVSDALFSRVSALVRAHLERSAADHGKSRTVVQPDWIDEDAFGVVCEVLGMYGVGATSNHLMPGATQFLEAMGTPRLTEDECLVAMADRVLAENARAALFARLIQRTRFGMNEGLKQAILKAFLVSFDSGVHRITEVDSLAMLSPAFVAAVKEGLTDDSDLAWFLGSLGLTSAASHEQTGAARHTFDADSGGLH